MGFMIMFQWVLDVIVSMFCLLILENKHKQKIKKKNEKNEKNNKLYKYGDNRFVLNLK